MARPHAILISKSGKPLATDSIAGEEILKVTMLVDPTQLITNVGSRSVPTSVTSSGVSFTASTLCVNLFVKGSGGAVTVTANPQISNGAFVGQKLKIFGTDDTNTVTFTDGNGFSLNGNYTMNSKSSMTLTWDGSNWVEDSRNDL